MSLEQLFIANDYRDVLKEYLGRCEGERGYRSRLAKAAGFQTSFLSQVLNGNAHLTPEHAMGISLFWEMTQAERDYFLELVHHGRAGTVELRSHSARRLADLREQSMNLKARYRSPDILNADEAQQYYSSWLFGAVHALSSIPQYSRSKAMAEKLGTSEEDIFSILLVLERLELVKRKSDGWEIGSKNIHLPKESPLNLLNHANWRAKALQDVLAAKNEASVHYSSIFTISEKDFERLQKRVLEFLDDARKLAVPSQEEIAAVLCLDAFPL